jgi:hypothetical protein
MRTPPPASTQLAAYRQRFQWLTAGATAGVLLAALAVCGSPLLADDVYLTNGRAFEGVIAELTDTQVRIRFADGELRLPRSQVLRIEEAETIHQRYLREAEALRADPSTRPEHWLDLARWAKVNQFERGSREAALVAAELAPELEGLAPLMRGLGYVLDEPSGGWVPLGDSMRRRGFVEHRGEWTTPAVRAERMRAEEVLLAVRRQVEEEQRQRRRDDALARLEQQLIEREQRPAAPTVQVVLPPYPQAFNYAIPGSVVVVRPPYAAPANGGEPAPVAGPRGRFDPTPGPTLNLYERQPGSLIPARGRF